MLLKVQLFLSANLLVAALCFFPATPCRAQEGGNSLFEKSAEDSKNKVANDSSISTNKEVQEFMAKMHGGSQLNVRELTADPDFQRKLASYTPPDSRTIQAKREMQLSRLNAMTRGKNTRVVKHLRSKNGVSFPASYVPDVKEIVENPAFKQVLALHSKAMSKENLEAKFPAPKLPPCSEDKTMKMPLKTSPSGKVQAGSMDMLYLDWAPPVDSQEIFGQRTIVYQFSTRDTDYISSMAGMMGVFCLPFRIRQTDKNVFWDMGLNALKNYEANPNDKGVFHAYIKAKFNIR